VTPLCDFSACAEFWDRYNQVKNAFFLGAKRSRRWGEKEQN